MTESSHHVTGWTWKHSNFDRIFAKISPDTGCVSDRQRLWGPHVWHIYMTSTGLIKSSNRLKQNWDVLRFYSLIYLFLLKDWILMCDIDWWKYEVLYLHTKVLVLHNSPVETNVKKNRNQNCLRSFWPPELQSLNDCIIVFLS